MAQVTSSKAGGQRYVPKTEDGVQVEFSYTETTLELYFEHRGRLYEVALDANSVGELQETLESFNEQEGVEEEDDGLEF